MCPLTHCPLPSNSPRDSTQGMGGCSVFGRNLYQRTETLFSIILGAGRRVRLMLTSKPAVYRHMRFGVRLVSVEQRTTPRAVRRLSRSASRSSPLISAKPVYGQCPDWRRLESWSTEGPNLGVKKSVLPIEHLPEYNPRHGQGRQTTARK
jgi:hypothetical protein